MPWLVPVVTSSQNSLLQVTVGGGDALQEDISASQAVAQLEEQPHTEDPPATRKRAEPGSASGAPNIHPQPAEAAAPLDPCSPDRQAAAASDSEGDLLTVKRMDVLGVGRQAT